MRSNEVAFLVCGRFEADILKCSVLKWWRVLH